MTAPAPRPSELDIEAPLSTGWEMATSVDPALPGAFIPLRSLSTVASALRERKAWRIGDGVRFDESHHWFRCRFDAEPAIEGEQVTLRFGGVATISEAWLNGHAILQSRSMFASHEVDVTRLLKHENELLVACRPLASALRERKGSRPAPRWKTRVVDQQQLRWFRTTLIGRAPGFSAEPEPVGPWRPVTIRRRREVALEAWSREVSLIEPDGIVAVDLRLRELEPGAFPRSGRLVVGESSAPLDLEQAGETLRARARLQIGNVARWWPHTHGEPALYPIRAEFQISHGRALILTDTPVGFRTLDGGPENGGLRLRINGAPVFCRGVVWTPIDPVSLTASAGALRERLLLLREGGCNMVRLAGSTVYECEAFHRLCDELGILVWQDMMFANMDYPFEDTDFMAAVRAEAGVELKRLSRHASTAVICGNSEIEQQAGMLGLDPSFARGPFFGEELPRLAASHCPGTPYVPSAPCGGDLPFRTNARVANYFGVGAYLRPLEDARLAEVNFAAECLAFSNVPEPEAIEAMALERGGLSPAHPAWKQGVPRDSGAGWDFEDVRDHYLQLLYAVDPTALRYSDASRYWELSRMVSGEVMAAVFGEWRRPASPCGGGIVLWGADLRPGAGWGILDSEGRPKCAYWFLKRAFAPVAVWMTGEGLNGVDVHAANDRPTSLDAVLRVALYHRGCEKVAEGESRVILASRDAVTVGVERILGRFADASYAYRFGPPGHDLIVASLHARSGDTPLAQCFYFPVGRTASRASIADLGVSAEKKEIEGGGFELILRSPRFAWGVRVAAPGFLPDDAYFGLEPGCARRVSFKPVCDPPPSPKPSLTAVSAEGRLRL